MAENLKQDSKRNSPLQIHWKGKIIEILLKLIIIEDIFETVERLPVLISCQGVDNFLGIPKIASGFGKTSEDAIHQLILRRMEYI